MNVLAINGSPSGKNSVTLYSALYLEKQFSNIHFEILEAAQQIKTIEKDFAFCKKTLEKANLII